MPLPHILLEVIVTDVDDAVRAVAGGADRVELVGAAERGGLTPTVEVVRAVVERLGVPVRAMVRRSESHQLTTGDVTKLVADIESLSATSVDGFVLGAARIDGSPDVEILRPAVDALAGRPWTFHRAIDISPSLLDAMRTVLGLPGCDTVLTSGHPDGVEAGMTRLQELLTDTSAPVDGLMIGGGLRQEHLDTLVAAGARAFHVGRTVRTGGTWEGPVDTDLVRVFRDRVEQLLANNFSGTRATSGRDGRPYP